LAVATGASVTASGVGHQGRYGGDHQSSHFQATTLETAPTSVALGQLAGVGSLAQIVTVRRFLSTPSGLSSGFFDVLRQPLNSGDEDSFYIVHPPVKID
jgi:hypothetical protein